MGTYDYGYWSNADLFTQGIPQMLRDDTFRLGQKVIILEADTEQDYYDGNYTIMGEGEIVENVYSGEDLVPLAIHFDDGNTLFYVSSAAFFGADGPSVEKPKFVVVKWETGYHLTQEFVDVHRNLGEYTPVFKAYFGKTGNQYKSEIGGDGENLDLWNIGLDDFVKELYQRWNDETLYSMDIKLEASLLFGGDRYGDINPDYTGYEIATLTGCIIGQYNEVQGRDRVCGPLLFFTASHPVYSQTSPNN